jgi:diphthamide synthase (EF-2-diphthine--ammonia ligase)
LWQQDQYDTLVDMVNSGVDAILVKVAAAGSKSKSFSFLGLNESHLGRNIGDMVHVLSDLVLNLAICS